MQRPSATTATATAPRTAEECEHEDDEGKKHTHQTTTSVRGELTNPIRACKMG
jgi:hypothetical protein